MNSKKFFIISTAILTIANFAFADLNATIEQILSRQGEILAGSDDIAGDYIVVRVELKKSWGDDSLARAGQEARSAVSKFFGVEVSGSTESSRESETVGTSQGHTTTFRRSFKKVSKSEFNQCIKGLSLDRVAGSNGSQSAVYVLSESQIQQVSSIAEAARSIGHTTDEDGATLVNAIGMALIQNGDIESARTRALASAQREAIEKVMGMVVVGLTQANNRQFSEAVFSNTDGFIDSWDEVAITNVIGDYYKIEINASIVPQKLFEDYRSHLQSMGDPTFGILSNDKDVGKKFAGYLNKLGLRIIDSSKRADWIVLIESDFDVIEDVTDPSKTRTVLSMSFEMHNKTTGDVIGPLRGPTRFSSRLSSPKRAKEEALNKGFNMWKKNLHTEINDQIVQMVRNGRQFDLSINCQIGDLDSTSFRECIVSLPGVNSGELEIETQVTKLRLKYAGKSEFLRDMVKEALYGVLSENQFDYLTVSSLTNDSLHFVIAN